jgi:molecular chaperone DnaK (HSP70)
MSRPAVYGIDLGTTTSLIARVGAAGEVQVLPNLDGQLATPSVVFFAGPGNVIVGEEARKALHRHPDRCVATVKRAMGRPDSERRFFGEVYLPQQISAFILRKLAEGVEVTSGERVREVVISCPAYFGTLEREAVHQAGELAGLVVRHVVSEPTAAAIAYGIHLSEEQVILIYDLGGGTFDVTVIEIRDRRIRVLYTGGDHKLGGKDWDEVVAEYLANRYGETLGLDPGEILGDPQAYADLIQVAEGAKRTLSVREATIADVRYDGERVPVELTRATFDLSTAHLLEQTCGLTALAMDEARLRSGRPVDRILLVGGSTLMPQVQRELTARFGTTVQRFDPHHAVVKGAALVGQPSVEVEGFLDDGSTVLREGTLCERFDGEGSPRNDHALPAQGAPVGDPPAGVPPKGHPPPTLVIEDVSPKSFGIVVVDARGRHVVMQLIEANSPIPTRVTRRIPTHEEGQRDVVLACMESRVTGQPEVELEATSELGEAVLAFDRPLPRGTPIVVTFELSAEGRLTVTGHEETTGARVETHFENRALLSRQALERNRERDRTIRVD